MKYFATGLISTLVSIFFMLAWLHYHPAQRIGKVDVLSILQAQQKQLESQVKPGMDEAAQKALIASATLFGKNLDLALGKVSAECGCVLLNSAAIVKDPSGSVLSDYTDRVRMIMSAR